VSVVVTIVLNDNIIWHGGLVGSFPLYSLIILLPTTGFSEEGFIGGVLLKSVLNVVVPWGFSDDNI